MGFGTQGVGLQGAGGNFGIQGLQQGGGGTDAMKISQLMDQLLKMLRGDDQKAQGGGKCNGGGGGQPAQGAEQAGMSLEDLIRELQRMARENPEAFKQAMQQNPAFMQVAQAALTGGGGAGSVGKA